MRLHTTLIQIFWTIRFQMANKGVEAIFVISILFLFARISLVEGMCNARCGRLCFVQCVDSSTGNINPHFYSNCFKGCCTPSTQTFGISKFLLPVFSFTYTVINSSSTILISLILTHIHSLYIFSFWCCRWNTVYQWKEDKWQDISMTSLIVFAS